MNFGPITLPEGITDRTEQLVYYRDVWEQRHAQAEQTKAWVLQRINSLGYKSFTQFAKQGNFGVTPQTVKGYISGGTMPLWAVPLFCYALKVTPNVFLTMMGIYEPDKLEKETPQTQRVCPNSLTEGRGFYPF